MINNFSTKRNIACRICSHNILKTYLDLGDQPPSNSFIHKETIECEELSSLQIQLCETCGLSQSDTIVAPNDIFNDYLY